MCKLIFTLSLVLFIACFVAAPEAAAQNVTIKLGGSIIIIPPKKVQTFKELAGPTVPGKSRRPRKSRKRYRRTAGAGAIGAIIGGGGLAGAGNVSVRLTFQAVEKLASQYQLTEKPKNNPQLVFSRDVIEYWRESGLSEPELKTEFAAIRTVLDAADSQKVDIRDHEMLFEAADEFIRLVEEENPSGKDDDLKKQEQPPEVSSLLCEGDTSEALIRQAWEALDAGKGGLGVEKLEKALACTRVTIERFAAQADEQQARRLQANECKIPPSVAQKEDYFRLYAALGDVGVAWFIRGQVFRQQQKLKEAREAYKVVIDKYSCAYAWDAKGWFWRIADSAELEIKKLP